MSQKHYEGTPFDIGGRVALVSGAAGLLGREFALALAQAGARVVMLDVDEDGLESAFQEVKNRLPEAELLPLQVDLANQSSIREGFKTIDAEAGPVDILVNSAAIDPKFDSSSSTDAYVGFPDFPGELWNLSLSVNLTGVFYLTQETCRRMEKKNKGSIINISSTYGMKGPDQRIYRKEGQVQQVFKPAAYSVTKAGMIGFTRYLSAYYAGTEIRVNTLSPGGVYNDHDEEFNRNYSSKTILGRMADRKEFHGPIQYLASDASSYMTGANLIVDGGWTAF